MTYGSALILGGLLALAAWVFAYLVGKIGENVIEGRPEVRWVEQALPRRSLIESKFDIRRSDLRARIAELQAELANLRRKRFTLEKELVDSKKEAESPIRVVGRENSTEYKFRAWVINRQVQQALGEGKSHPTLDVEWATPQVVEIWADNLNDARRDLQRLYPMPLGFSLLNIRLEGGMPGAEAPAEAQAAQTVA